MQGVVPAAGKGTRLRPLTDDRPKGLIEVAGEPVLTHCFEQLLGHAVLCAEPHVEDDFVPLNGETCSEPPSRVDGR